MIMACYGENESTVFSMRCVAYGESKAYGVFGRAPQCHCESNSFFKILHPHRFTD